jgi:glycosyltransferase involved in cell wall biosynthesis
VSPRAAPKTWGLAMPDRRFRVLAVATHPVQYMTPIFRRLAKHPALDFHVAYCTLRGAEAGHDPEFGADIQWDVPLLDGYSWTHVPNRGSGAESFFGLFNPRMGKLIRSGNYDAVLCFIGYVRATFWIACLASKLSRTAFLFGTDTTTLEPRDARRWKVAVKKILWPGLFRLADQVIVPSSGSRDMMLSLGIPGERVTLTPYSVDNDWWIQQSKQVDRAAVRASWGVSPNDAVIVFSAKLQQWKRPLDLLRAFAKANLPNAFLVFAGTGPLLPQLESEAASLGVASPVRFLGFVNQSQLPAVYTSADLLVLPSEFEPFGLVVNEAMCCGCAAAVSDRAGAARDLVAPLCPDFVFRCGDIGALAELMKKATAGPARLKDLGRAALAYIQTWSPERNIGATVDAIRMATSRLQPNSITAPSDSVAHKSAVPASQKSQE